MKSEREKRLEEAFIDVYATLKMIAANPGSEINHIRAGTVLECIRELHEEVKNNALIAG